MHRLKQKAEFIVPFGGGGRTTTLLWEHNLLGSCRRTLRGERLVTIDFAEATSDGQRGDVYCDPAYTEVHNNGNESTFPWEDQKSLAQSCRSTANEGALVIVSNAYHKEVLDLFAPPHNLVVSRIRRLCPDVAYRRSIEEYLFVFPTKDREKRRRGSHEE